MSIAGPFSEAEKAKFTVFAKIKDQIQKQEALGRFTQQEKARYVEWLKHIASSRITEPEAKKKLDEKFAQAPGYFQRVEEAESKLITLEKKRDLNFSQYGLPALKTFDQVKDQNSVSQGKMLKK